MSVQSDAKSCEAMKSAKHVVQVPEASIGQMGKQIQDLCLIFDDEILSLAKENDPADLVVQQFKWKDITGINLRYNPLSLHQLILEVKTSRIRDTTGKVFVDHFVVLNFHTKDIARIEEEIEKRNLNHLVKEGISQVMVYPPFSYAYSVPLRKGINLLGKVTRAFTTLCLIYSILSWLGTCPKGSPESCTTILGHFLSIARTIFSFVPSLITPTLVSVYEYLETIPVLKYFVFTIGTLIFLPLWSWFALLGAIVYLSEFAVQFHLFLYLFQALSVLVTQYKAINGLLSYVISTITLVWTTGHSFYLRAIKPKPKPTPAGKKND